MKSKWRTCGGILLKSIGCVCSLRVLFNDFYFLVGLNGPSMEPTFHTGDIIVGERHPKNITSGNILVLRSPFDPDGYIVKRLMGLPGDIKRCGLSFTKVPEGHMWLEGDNASNSRDSRVFGPVPQGLVTGRVLYKIWPLSDVRAF